MILKGQGQSCIKKEKPTTMTMKSLPAEREKTKISEQEAHELFGHRNKKIDKITAEKLGYKFVGEPMKCCWACEEAKAKK